MEGFKIRFAAEADIGLLLEFIKGLAEYERMLDQVVATEEILKEWLFTQKKAEAVIGEFEGKPVAFSIFFHNFSTFLGRAGIYIEDLFVLPGFRGKGFGKALLTFVAKLALRRGCGRVEWSCLNWNEPSIQFYLSLGAKPASGWTVYRLAGETLAALGGKT